MTEKDCPLVQTAMCLVTSSSLSSLIVERFKPVLTRCFVLTSAKDLHPGLQSPGPPEVSSHWTLFAGRRRYMLAPEESVGFPSWLCTAL